MFLWKIIIIITSIENGARPNIIIVYRRCHLACHLCSYVTSEQYRSTIIYWAKFICTTDVSKLWSYTSRFYCSFEREGGELYDTQHGRLFRNHLRNQTEIIELEIIDKLRRDNENVWTSSKLCQTPSQLLIPSLTKILFKVCFLQTFDQSTIPLKWNRHVKEVCKTKNI